MKKGFSLVELIVVIAIVAILSAISVPVYRSYAIRASIQDVLNYLETRALDEKIRYSKVGVWGNNGFQVLDNTNIVNPESSIPKITLLQRHYNSSGGWRLYLAAIFDINNSATVGGVSSGYLALVCSETNNIVDCECRTAFSSTPEEIRPEYLPPACQCNVLWSVACP